ncbi:hypothetical protein D9757_000620 [Collybiopsis confluens]|uniref:Uncharacterized protein n=1 Tax=Collybiopsis confluens TaxID=2823264 RepID=A0A8H5I1F7_9AGAR|nr:hypothetical protein D9757_000620 [Collybiopsis confluens]
MRQNWSPFSYKHCFMIWLLLAFAYLLGAYTVVFGLTIWALVTNCPAGRKTNKMMLSVSAIIFVLATMHIGDNYTRVFMAFRTAESAPASTFCRTSLRCYLVFGKPSSLFRFYFFWLAPVLAFRILLLALEKLKYLHSNSKIGYPSSISDMTDNQPKISLKVGLVFSMIIVRIGLGLIAPSGQTLNLTTLPASSPGMRRKSAVHRLGPFVSPSREGTTSTNDTGSSIPLETIDRDEKPLHSSATGEFEP